MKIAAIQMCSGKNLQTNLNQAHDLLQQAKQAGAEWAVLPEYFCFMGDSDHDRLQLAEQPDQGVIQTFLSNTAKNLQIGLIGGTIPMVTKNPQQATNTTLVYNHQGECLTRYDKIHLFAFDNGRERYNEAKTLLAGQRLAHFQASSPQQPDVSWKMGLSICFDLRFGAMYRALASDVLILPAAFTETTGQAHWEVLLRARAIENQAYVVASAQGGVHENGRKTFGHSMIIDPWGRILAMQATGLGVVIADLQWHVLQDVRRQLPVLSLASSFSI